jgi:hypothetical protein
MLVPTSEICKHCRWQHWQERVKQISSANWAKWECIRMQNMQIWTCQYYAYEKWLYIRFCFSYCIYCIFWFAYSAYGNAICPYSAYYILSWLSCHPFFKLDKNNMQNRKRPTPTQSTCLYYDHDTEASKWVCRISRICRICRIYMRILQSISSTSLAVRVRCFGIIRFHCLDGSWNSTIIQIWCTYLCRYTTTSIY